MHLQHFSSSSIAYFPICLMSVSLSTLTISSSFQIPLPNIMNMCEKSYDVSEQMACMQTSENVISISHLSNTLDTSFLLPVSPWPQPKYSLSLIGLSHRKLKTFSLSLVLLTSIIVSSIITLTLSFPSLASLRKIFPGIFLIPARLPLSTLNPTSSLP